MFKLQTVACKKKVRKKKPLEFGSTSFVKTVECCLFFFSFPWLNVACFFLGFPWLNVVCFFFFGFPWLNVVCFFLGFSLLNFFFFFFFFLVFHYLRVQQHSESTYIYRYTYKETHTQTHTHIYIYIKPAYQVRHFVLKYLLAFCLPKSRILVFRFIIEYSNKLKVFWSPR